MARDDGTGSQGESVAEQRKRAPSLWVVLGSVVFVLAFVLGWRAAGKKRPAREATPTHALPA